MHNFCCSGKAISIIYSECMFVALGIHHAVLLHGFTGVLISPQPDQEGNKLPNSGFIQHSPPRSSIHFLARCSNFLEVTLKTFIKVVRPTRSPRRQ